MMVVSRWRRGRLVGKGGVGKKSNGRAAFWLSRSQGKQRRLCRPRPREPVHAVKPLPKLSPVLRAKLCPSLRSTITKLQVSIGVANALRRHYGFKAMDIVVIKSDQLELANMWAGVVLYVGAEER